LELIGKELGMWREHREDSFEWDGDLTKLTMPQLLKLAASMQQLDGGAGACFRVVDVKGELAGAETPAARNSIGQCIGNI
jgi:hypothetical protein